MVNLEIKADKVLTYASYFSMMRHMFKGLLFTTDFLHEGIQSTRLWQEIDNAEFTAFKAKLTKIFSAVSPTAKLGESATEEAIIEPTLRAVGWEQYSRGITAARSGRADVPDFALFEDGEAKGRALAADAGEAYRHSASILEAKKWNRYLDRAPNARDDNSDKEVPSTQILRYMSRVETLSDRRVQFGILTNGRLWRLYWQGARSRSEDYLEIDLPIALGLAGYQADFTQTAEGADHALKVFWLLFGHKAFLPFNAARSTFHQFALDEARHWEARVTSKLSDAVFTDVFPALVRGLAKHDPDAKIKSPAYREEVRQAALTMLYRLLFIFYAEDRELLPVRSAKYDDYALRKVREEVMRRLDADDALSDTRSTFFTSLTELCEGIDKGDKAIGLPPYNGGLFDSKRSPLLTRTKLPDSITARVVDGLSRTREGQGRKQWINYRDLSVQQLGSIYERLLEFRLVVDDDHIGIEPNAFARKTSGSYYTPEVLVRLVLEQAVGPLLAEKRKAFYTAVDAGKPAKELAKLDPATAMLELKICDPAMGSGHFLVSLVDYMADQILEAITKATDYAEAKDVDYHSPLLTRLATIRQAILKNATDNAWDAREDQLEDKHLIRRMVLKKVIYGVDKNPMAVELAKLSLWLHTFTVGAPLSFLDHHLRCGDSLFGEWVGQMTAKAEHPLFVKQLADEAIDSTKDMQGIEDAPDAEIAGVKQSASMFAKVQAHTKRLYRLMHLIHAQKWLADSALASVVDDIVNGQRARSKNSQSPLEAFLIEKDTQWDKATNAALAEIEELLTDENFLHWEVAFPGVWTDWQQQSPVGGFDAVIGNPPWDRMKLQEVEWFAERKPAIAMQTRASDRKRMIKEELERGTPLGKQYQLAKHRAERSTELARTSGEYPLLGGGDINLYSLFVERAHKLVNPHGMMGLVTPSGIYADKNASVYFKGMASKGRIASLFDFENRKVFFEDVHMQFKFCILTTGGTQRSFAETLCGFQLKREDVEPALNPERTFPLSASDFLRVNPNTGTAPVLLTRRDADLMLAIHKRTPVLVHKTFHAEQPDKVKDIKQAWPVKYTTMFHMTNDAKLFKTRAELEADGFYQAGPSLLKKGPTEYRPLYVGKMIWHFDHRASSVGVNEDALHVAANSDYTTPAQHQDPAYTPEPQYWVDWAEAQPKLGSLGYLLTFRDITNATNARTMVASIIPASSCGNTLPILLPENGNADGYVTTASTLAANFSAFAFDYIARMKAQGTHLNWYIVEQLPVLPPKAYEQKFGKETAAELVKRSVLELTYTANDLEPFARELGYTGQPFAWDEDKRRHLRARLDALYFHLYGLSADDAAYIMDSFPIVRRHDEAAFNGRYLTKELVLAYYKALAAGDTMSTMVVR
ncbi:MAG: restriction endonuclease [Alphaproteobacteria bacterium]